jgi:nucleoside-diphosphate-sugar epimerase
MRRDLSQDRREQREQPVRIVVTGAAGFIGLALCRGLAVQGHRVLGLTRGPTAPFADVELCAIGGLDRRTDWTARFAGADCVIHLANRAHRRRDRSAALEPETAAALAQAAAAAGVQRLVYLSSLLAMGEATRRGQPFRAGDQPQPRGPYGRGKLASEDALRLVSERGQLELVILRPPLVYGPGVKANFRALIGLAASGLPLPFAAVDNRRSLLFIDNLVQLIALACVHPAAAGGAWLARDGEDWSTPALLRALAAGLGRPARLYAVPEPLLAPLRRLPVLGRRVAALTLSLQADDRATREALGWAPAIAAAEALAVTAASFRDGADRP